MLWPVEPHPACKHMTVSDVGIHITLDVLPTQTTAVVQAPDANSIRNVFLLQALATVGVGKAGSGTSSSNKAGKRLLGILNLPKATEQALIRAISNVPARLRHIPIQV